MNENADRYLNPFTDFGFKRIFGEEMNKDLLIDFLNVLITDNHIKDLTYRKSEKLGSNEYERKAVFDLYCENELGEKFIVEIQKSKHDFFKDRSIYYSTFPIQEQAIQGNWNYELKAVYTIGILDFVFDDENKDKTVVIEVKLMNTKTNTVFFDKLTYIYLQMPNFNKTEEELETQYDKWLYVFKNLHKLQNRPQKLQEKVFERLFEIAEIAKFTRDEYLNYIDNLKIYRDLYSVLSFAKSEGKEEERRRITINGIKSGLSNELISSITGLHILEIEEFRKNN
jgi:predicted transposase/invertase (TIGR01784 family)